MGFAAVFIPLRLRVDLGLLRVRLREFGTGWLHGGAYGKLG